VLDQFKDLIEHLNRGRTGPRLRGHINVTGGEPFVRADFPDLLDAFRREKEYLDVGILTNGTFLDEPTVRRLRKLGVAWVQVSLEGGRETNDRIRGPGAFDRTLLALKHLVRERVPSAISFTAHRGNFREFPDVAQTGRELGVTLVWADRLIPYGRGSELREQLLSPEETLEFFEIMYASHNDAARGFCRTKIAMHRALQFLVGGGRPYQCGAGNWLVTIQPNGDLYPCRRMPVRVGNVMETPLVELYEESDLFRALRVRDRVSEGCEACRYAQECRGGLRCLSYALTGDPFEADPGCWHALRTREREGCAAVLP
jgi:radical SAM protein with 4Fe4S-binding SPASM domain